MKKQITRIDRSAAKLLPGAMALAATTTGSQAATVQITLTGNKISTTGGNQLVADLTGDGLADVVFSQTIVRGTWVQVLVNEGGVLAGYESSSYFARAKFNDHTYVGEDSYGGFPVTATVLNAITFTDSRINDGDETEAWLEVHAFNTSQFEQMVEFTRLIFDDSSTIRPAFTEIPETQTEWGAVPEPSSLALLGLGAGGLLTRRRRAKAA